MKHSKKVFMFFVLTASLIVLAACSLKNLVDLEVNLLQTKIEIFEGEGLPTDKLEVVGIYSDGSRQVLDFNHEKLKYEYNSNPDFDHMDPLDTVREEIVKVSYNNKHIVEVPY